MPDPSCSPDQKYLPNQKYSPDQKKVARPKKSRPTKKKSPNQKKVAQPKKSCLTQKKVGGTSSWQISCSLFSKDFFAIILIRNFHKFAIIRNSRERESMRNNGYHELGVGTVCAVHIVLLSCHKHLFFLQKILALPFFSSLTQLSVRPSMGHAFLKNQEFKKISYSSIKSWLKNLKEEKSQPMLLLFFGEKQKHYFLTV